ncbi:MAG TPA: O-antigen ligase family protein [Casimicrobiaceae bacterium]|nr:O-antigen ligase family protein [Casimicrobiaceae bacterium]
MLTEKNIVSWQLWAAAAYLALLPSNGWTFTRSLAFGLCAGFAAVILVAGYLGRSTRVPSPGADILAPLLLWCAWCVASLAWSVNVDYSIGQLDREIGWSLLAMAGFYVAASSVAAWRTLVSVALATFAAYALLALGEAATPEGWDPSRWHAGVGPYATHVVLVAPLLLTLPAPRPVGFNGRKSTLFAGFALLVLLLASARLTDNRMVWIALAATFASGYALAAWRWHASLARAPLRWLSPLFALLIVLGVVFADVTRERALSDFPPHTPVAQTLTADPRLSLWEETAQLIREHPWTGYGFGRAIVADQLKGSLGNPMLWHAHNLFVGQIVQTGIVGFALFAALLIAVCARFVRYVRRGDDALAVIGIVGASLVAGFLVKNLTDDFLFRTNAKEFWALLAVLVGLGTRLERTRPPGD